MNKLLIAFSILVVLLCVLPIQLNQADLNNYITSSKMIFDHKSPYNVVEFFAPPWMSLLMIPFLFSNILWLMTNLVCLFLVSYMIFDLLDIKKHKLLFTLLISIAPTTIFIYVSGQVTVIVFLAMMLAAKQVINRQVNPSIVLWIVIATLKPHIVIVPLFFLIWELRKEIRIILLMTFVALSLVFLWFIPSWPMDMISAIMNGDYRISQIGYNPIQIPVVLSVILLVILVAYWLRHGFTALSLSFMIVIGLLVIPYYRSYDLVVLLLPMMMVKHKLLLIPAYCLLLVPFSSYVYILPIYVLLLLTFENMGIELCMKNCVNDY